MLLKGKSVTKLYTSKVLKILKILIKTDMLNLVLILFHYIFINELFLKVEYEKRMGKKKRE